MSQVSVVDCGEHAASDFKSGCCVSIICVVRLFSKSSAFVIWLVLRAVLDYAKFLAYKT